MTNTEPALPNSPTLSKPTVPGKFELPARAASGVVMGVAMVVALVFGGIVFAAVVAAAAIAALREWHRLINAGRLAREMIPTGLAMAAAALLVQPPAKIGMALLAIAAGAGVAAGSAALRRLPALWPIPWHAFGAPYIGFTVLALIVLRGEPLGTLLVGGLFVAVWTADTGALLIGRTLGGPKLAPWLSPNKTWAGFIGGTLAAGAAEAIYVFLFDGSAVSGLAFGLLLALAGHLGDLFESWVKRQFHAKNTGSLIPGHGGMLDRIDSLLFAAPACVGLIFSGFTPFPGIIP